MIFRFSLFKLNILSLYGVIAGWTVLRLQRVFPAFVFLSLLGFLLIFPACQETPVPKPRGYFRIDFPEKSYTMYSGGCPFTFEYPVYSRIRYESEPCWMTLDIPEYKASIYLTYKPVSGNFDRFLEDSRKIVYQNIALKADAVEEYLFSYPDRKVYGMVYSIQGNAASNLQFYATDSLRHFLRGSLYFSLPPDKDSLAPAIEFFTQDIWHLVGTLSWREN